MNPDLVFQNKARITLYLKFEIGEKKNFLLLLCSLSKNGSELLLYIKTKKQGNLPFSSDSVSVCAAYDRLLLYGTGLGPRTFGPVRIMSG